MEKIFTTVLPDEPYKTSTKKNITVQATYKGPRYLLLRCRVSDGAIMCVDRASDDYDWLQTLITTNEPELFFVTLDAETHTWEAAHLTHNYEHGEIENYVEVLPTGEKYEYWYDDYVGALNQPFYVNDMFYDKGTSSFKRPKYRVHAVAKEDFWASIESNLKTFEAAVGNIDRYPADKQQAIRDHYDFLKTAKSKYGSIDHWKIPFPPMPSLA